MAFTILKRVLIILPIEWIASSDATGVLPPIRNSEIKAGVLVFFWRNRIQKSTDLDQRAEQLDAQLARILDPPFDSVRRRVNIEKVFDPSVTAGVKPKYLTLATTMFDDQTVLAPSPNQKLKIEIFKIPADQPIGETIIKQIILANRFEHCDTAFLIYRTLTADMVNSLLQRTARCNFCVSRDPKEVHHPEQECLVRFLDKITSPSHLDNNTLDDFRELVANYVFRCFAIGDYDVETFAEMVNGIPCMQGGTSKCSKILRIYFRNLLRHKPTMCPKLEVMRDDFVDYQMVEEMLIFIWQKYIYHDSFSTVRHLPTLYKLMDSDATITKAMWDWGVTDTKNNIAGLVPIADFVSRKIGLITKYEDRYTHEQVLRKVKEIRNVLNRGWDIYMRAQVFANYWQHLYKLKRSGFSGRIAIVNRDYILEDSWIQSLFGIFGRENTMIEQMTQL